MTEHEIDCATALANVRIASESARLFVEEMHRWSRIDPDRSLSEKQALWLATLAWKYRGFIPDQAVANRCRAMIDRAEQAKKWGPATFKD